MAVASSTIPGTVSRESPGLSPTLRLVSGLLAGNMPLTPPADFDGEHFLRWCRNNKLPLIGLAGDMPGWLRDDSTVKAAVEAECEWYELQRREYLAVETAWQARGIECLMIKSAGNPPSFPHTSDNIDILVHRGDGPVARAILRSLGYVEIRNVEEPEKFLFRRFHAGRCVSAIHVHERIAWFVGFLDDGAVWRRSRPADDDPRVRIPAPEDAVLINLAHACYENKELRLLEVLRVRHALRSAGEAFDWGYLARVAEQRGWLDGLAFMLLTHAVAERWVFGETSIPASQTARCRAIIQGDAAISQQRMALEASRRVDLPIDLGFLFCKRLYYRKILRDPARSRSERGRDIAATLIWGIRLKSGLRPQRGMIVTLSGPDGSGKTRHAETLVAALRQCEIRADYLWSRGGSTGIFRPASRLRRKLRGEGHDRAGATDDPIVRRRRRLENPLLRFGWAWLVAVDQLATYWLRAYLPARRGRVVITDRYLHDAVVELEASLPASARWSRMAARALLTCGPRPTLGYLLDLSATTARLRKPDEAWHIDWQRERERYRELAGLHGLRELSVEGSFEDSSDPLVHEVVMAFMARYETRLNGLFYSNPSQKNEPDPIWLGGGAR